MTGNLAQYAEILKVQKQYHELQYAHWLQYQFLTTQWWMLVGALIIPWIIWWRVVDKTKTGIILAYGLYMLLVVTAMDAIGYSLQLWIYPVQLLPVIPDSIGIDWGFLTVLHMLIFQYFPKWKSFLFAQTIAAALLAFIGEPFTEWIGVYYVLHWYHHWSFPIYIVKAVFGKWLVEKIVYSK